jgi:predicted metal-dependent phosphotriesterase family hydrolase
MRDLIKGAYDLHVHSAPDVLPRKMDDIEMAQRIIAAGMAGYAIKSHYFCTSERAQLVNKMFPECHTIGAITLNSSVGGINPTAVEMAARSGAKIVWFPTCDSEHELSHVFNGDPNKKLPYWAQIIIQLKEDGIKTPTIKLLNDSGKLKDEVYDVIDVIAKNNIILATAHSSHEETFALVKAAYERKVEKIIITHVDFPTTFYTIDEQKELAKYGAYMEHCYTTYATGKIDFETTLDQIRAIGADRVILGTDLGQKTALYPDEGLLDFATKLYDNGFTENEIRKMTVDNNTKLIS